jgi:hypothetical protein
MWKEAGPKLKEFAGKSKQKKTTAIFKSTAIRGCLAAEY